MTSAQSVQHQHQHQHHHQPDDFWTRPHDEAVVLDIGGDVGALILYTPPALHGREIEVSPLGQDTARVHSAVLERRVAGRSVFCAVYPELPAGTYRLWGDDPDRPGEVTVLTGRVAEVDWR